MSEYEPRPAEPTSEPTTESGLPLRVGLAMEFVRQCNTVMSYSRSTAACECCPERVVTKEVELHPAQEGTFRKALTLLGRYFEGKL